MKKVSDEDRKLFEEDFKQARSIKAVVKPRAAKKKITVTAPSGVNGGTDERMRKGLLEPDARIDLHGLTEGAAHRVLFAYLAGAQSRGYRLVLVVTGKGNPRRDETASWMVSPHGVLKQMVPRWLAQPELAAMIASIRPAHVRHGGDGALYVYLRKSR
jgi:DNA-nicking Smr family endonuclease